ncbi:hypothetical protein NSMM_380075 [Nitrosomonas mobilis]|uniref:Uncharacterized protein n=1 Tax=Nitrosomonas mobilis TaxID=51642 RepID=A0A1G5SE35_9PROT|nr:hypothetical protein NSMM_380075 [Nitrosomonas mobilis]
MRDLYKTPIVEKLIIYNQLDKAYDENFCNSLIELITDPGQFDIASYQNEGAPLHR